MKILSTLLLTSLAIHAQPVFIGTGADGIYLSNFDPEKGTLTEPTLAIKFQRPGFLALHPEKPILYSIGGNNTVAGFTVAEDYALTLLGTAPCGGKGPCHLAIDASGRTLTVANYGGGSVVSIRLGADGKPGKTASVIQIEGSGPNENRQKSPHTHGVYFDNANRFLFAPDLGVDKTLIYKFDPATSELTANEPAHFTAPPGSGPRHMAFSPNEKHAYIINELTNTISAAAFNQDTGALTEVQTISTLPGDFKDGTTAEIEVHPNGNFVYGSNRGHNSIVVYKRDPETGKLTYVQHAPCGGEIPRHFKIDPSGKWLICGHQKSNTISVLSLDPKTGMLGEPQSTVKAPKPICILFP
ncbi:MAG: lactonase family protein [Verrucomicrobia bacterium]|jgi:6-phosphogluconolactonase|nr:lactonase family protein [Verrucomicrobiota bacterium]|tara:strand:+ start:7655 stop:8722 length:1068 start_codon:yes stop_codon:yes gene_type:complete